MAPIWRRLETIFQERYPSLFASLNPPATVEQLDAFEKTTRLNLPADVRDSYLLHDGSTGVGGYGEGDGPLLFCGYRWATLSEARERWQEYYDVDPYDELDDSAYSYTEAELPDCWAADKVRPWNMVFSPRWFPIGRRGNDSHGGWFIDLLPGPKGHHGQLIEKLTGATSLVLVALPTTWSRWQTALNVERLSTSRAITTGPLRCGATKLAAKVFCRRSLVSSCQVMHACQSGLRGVSPTPV